MRSTATYAINHPNQMVRDSENPKYPNTQVVIYKDDVLPDILVDFFDACCEKCESTRVLHHGTFTKEIIGGQLDFGLYVDITCRRCGHVGQDGDSEFDVYYKINGDEIEYRDEDERRVLEIERFGRGG